MFGSFLPSLRSSINHSLLGSRSRHCYAIKSLLTALDDKRTPKLANADASNDDLGPPQAAYFRHGEDGAASATCFSRLSSRNRLSPAPAQNQITKPVPCAVNAVFCRFIFLQLPSSQLDMAEACGSRIHPLSESKGVTRRRNLSKTTRRNTSERLLPTDCPRVSFTRFSSPAAPFEPPCYSLSAMLPEPPVCRCSRLSEYQRDGVAPAAPSHQPSRRAAWSNSCV